MFQRAQVDKEIPKCREKKHAWKHTVTSFCSAEKKIGERKAAGENTPWGQAAVPGSIAGAWSR